MLESFFRSVLLMGLFFAQSVLAGPYDQINDPEASRYAILYAEQSVGQALGRNSTDRYPAIAFGDRVSALHKDNGAFFYFANLKG